MCERNNIQFTTLFGQSKHQHLVFLHASMINDIIHMHGVNVSVVLETSDMVARTKIIEIFIK